MVGKRNLLHTAKGPPAKKSCSKDISFDSTAGDQHVTADEQHATAGDQHNDASKGTSPLASSTSPRRGAALSEFDAAKFMRPEPARMVDSCTWGQSIISRLASRAPTQGPMDEGVKKQELEDEDEDVGQADIKRIKDADDKLLKQDIKRLHMQLEAARLAEQAKWNQGATSAQSSEPTQDVPADPLGAAGDRGDGDKSWQKSNADEQDIDAAEKTGKAPMPSMPFTGFVDFLSGRVSHSASKNGWRVWPNIINIKKTQPILTENIVPYGEDPAKSFQDALHIIKKYCDAIARQR